MDNQLIKKPIYDRLSGGRVLQFKSVSGREKTVTSHSIHGVNLILSVCVDSFS